MPSLRKIALTAATGGAGLALLVGAGEWIYDRVGTLGSSADGSPILVAGGSIDISATGEWKRIDDKGKLCSGMDCGKSYRYVSSDKIDTTKILVAGVRNFLFLSHDVPLGGQTTPWIIDSRPSLNDGLGAIGIGTYLSFADEKHGIKLSSAVLNGDLYQPGTPEVDGYVIVDPETSDESLDDDAAEASKSKKKHYHPPSSATQNIRLRRIDLNSAQYDCYSFKPNSCQVGIGYLPPQ